LIEAGSFSDKPQIFCQEIFSGMPQGTSCLTQTLQSGNAEYEPNIPTNLHKNVTDKVILD
jgi:hypothetical protein